MTTLEVVVDVPEGRQVTLTLPPDTPTGRVRVMVLIGDSTPSHVIHYRPADPAEASEFEAFVRMLPLLRVTHGHQYVAISGGRIIAAGLSLDGVRRLARVAVGVQPYYVGWVEPTGGYMPRSGKVEIVDGQVAG